MRRFVLIRSEDVTGVFGAGMVAEGVQFHDGIAAAMAAQWGTITQPAQLPLFDTARTA